MVALWLSFKGSSARHRTLFSIPRLCPRYDEKSGTPPRASAARPLGPILLPSERRLVQEVVRTTDRLQATGIDGVGVEDAISSARRTPARYFGRLLVLVVYGLEVVLDGCDGLVQSCVEIVVEVTAVGRVPQRSSPCSPCMPRSSPAARGDVDERGFTDV